MSSKIRIAVVAALAFGSASAALADEQFDVNIYRPVVQESPLGAFAQTPRAQWGNGTAAPRPFSAEEKELFERMSGVH